MESDDLPAQMIETATFLGPFFRISPLQTSVTNVYFSSPKTRDKGYIVNSQKALRMALGTHQSDLLEIINNFIRASKEAREATLNWFAQIMNKNHKRRAMRVDPKTVSSDGFMVNVTICLDGLCEPFMDSTFSKVSKIDLDYLRRKPRVDISEETKLNADQKESDHFYSTTAEGTSNFISEVFFLTLAAHHYGTEACNAKLGTLDREIKQIEKHLLSMEADRVKMSNVSRQSSYEKKRR